MPLVTRPTVLVLGAGASIPYGYPSGSGLVTKILQCLSDVTVRSILRELGFSGEDVLLFAKALQRADPFSIDEFLEQHERYWRIGKAAVAVTLLKDENKDYLYPNQSNYPQGVGEHWYQYLAYFLCGGISYDSFLSNHRLSIITFNYDRSLEEYLYRVFSGRYEGDPKALVDSLKITHVHGHLGKLGWEDQNDGRSYGSEQPLGANTAYRVQEAARQIKIVCEAIPDHDAEFSLAHELLREAKIVCFLGFGYHASNLQRLRFVELTRDAERFGTTRGIGEAQWAVACRDMGSGIVQGFDRSDLGCLDFLRSKPALVRP